MWHAWRKRTKMGEGDQLEEVEIYEDNIKVGMGRRRQLIWCLTGRSGSCRHGRELSGYLKCRGFLNQLTNYWHLKRRQKE
jgi:hypothetical protein